MRQPGFPEPLFDQDDPSNVIQFVDYVETSEGGFVRYLLFEAPVGGLRAADPILADLTVEFRQAWTVVASRLHELGFYTMGRPTRRVTFDLAAWVGANEEESE